MKHSTGFTIIELVFVVLLLGSTSVLFFVQKNSIETSARDDKRKISINALYYGLEEIYHKNNGSYPRTLTKETLPYIDPDLFMDPNNLALGQTTVEIGTETYPVQPDYSYEGTNCDGESCKSYTLRSTLENEDDFVKTSRSH